MGVCKGLRVSSRVRRVPPEERRLSPPKQPSPKRFPVLRRCSSPHERRPLRISSLGWLPGDSTRLRPRVRGCVVDMRLSKGNEACVAHSRSAQARVGEHRKLTQSARSRAERVKRTSTESAPNEGALLPSHVVFPDLKLDSRTSSNDVERTYSTASRIRGQGADSVTETGGFSFRILSKRSHLPRPLAASSQ